jgi:light-regulated signal transduction histidine kinase (bacteriophytochrome)
MERFKKLEYEEAILSRDIPVRRKDGSVFYADISAASPTMAGKKYTIGIFRDTTERKQAEETQRELIEDLKRTNAEIEQFNHLIAHDLQEPLRMVTNYLQLLIRRSQDKLDADALEFVGYAVEGSKLMQGMIKDLLNYSRMDTRHGRCPPVNLDKVLDQALSNLRMAIDESGAVIDHGVLPAVCADESQMLHLLQNLIGNALKFRTKDAPRIAIAAQEKPDEIVVSVTDNGIGIDPQFSERIFQIFQRLHPRSEYPGNGIGLAFCKKIVEGHGGRIWVESSPGKGSKFYFTLPRKGGVHG